MGITHEGRKEQVILVILITHSPLILLGGITSRTRSYALPLLSHCVITVYRTDTATYVS